MNSDTYYETPWLYKGRCGMGCCEYFESRGGLRFGHIEVCMDGLDPFELNGAKKIKICTSSKRVDGALYSKECYSWVDIEPDRDGGIWWWVEVEG